MKYALSSKSPAHAGMSCSLFEELVSQFAQQGESFPIFSTTAETLREICNPEDLFIPFNLLDVLTVALNRYAQDVRMPRSSVHDAVASQQSFITLMHSILQMRDDPDQQVQAHLLAWRTFVESGICRLRGNLFPEARVLEIACGDETYNVEIDAYAIAVVDELSMLLAEVKYGLGNDIQALEYFIGNLMHGRYKEWDEFLHTLPVGIHPVLNAELVRVVTNGLATRFAKVS